MTPARAHAVKGYGVGIVLIIARSRAAAKISSRPVFDIQSRNVAKIRSVIGHENRPRADRMRRDHPIIIASPDPSAMGNDLSVCDCGGGVEWQNGNMAEKDLQPDLPHRRVFR